MPKNKKPIETTRVKRQASKVALKQLQLLLDDEDEDTFVIADDSKSKEIRLEPPLPPPPKKRAVSPVRDSPPPRKKYKLSHRKSSDGNDRDVIVLKSISHSTYIPKEDTLDLECYVEDLSEVQRERLRKAELEEEELKAKLDTLLKSKKAEVVFSGDISTAVEVNELISNCGKKTIFNPNDIPQLDDLGEQPAPTYQLLMDPNLGILMGNSTKSTNPVRISSPPVTKGKLQISSAVKAVATLPTSDSPPPVGVRRTRRCAMSTPPPLQPRTNSTTTARAANLGVMTRGNTPRSGNASSTRGMQQVSGTSPTIQTRGMKASPVIQARSNKATPPSKRPGVPTEKTKQVVDLTSEEGRNQADNREISFNKLQGKTYPSLVVVARPHLRVTDLAVDRPKLDAKVKSVLMHPPTKFTEWLIQQGLIRAEQKCAVHSNTQLKLGMYSDAAKFPFSGGYVWISECCPQRFVSVFNGSLFEGSPHPPVVMLKLIYHWSCQTNIQNVTQWVKVENLYVKGVYTWLRAVCTVAVQSRLRQLGGPGNRVEVGVISLGTTSHDGNQRQVKVEVLGVLESNTKYVRLRAVEPMPDGERNFRKKFSKILEPILQWVHPSSTIVTDLTVDKATLNHMGFTNVIQTTSNDYLQSNRTIMEYLRRIVPRMFQNTLSLLSRQIIQQFLDELVWREWFGISSQMAFDNIIAHLAEQTRLAATTPLVIKLNKVAANPFRSWSNGQTNTVPPSIPVPTPVPQASTTSAAAAAAAVVTPVKAPVVEIKKYGRGKKSSTPQAQVVQERPTKPVSPDVPEQMVPLENYYYGTIEAIDPSPPKIKLNMKCPFCKSTFDNNILLQNHLFKHAHNVSMDAYLCRYCLTSVSTANELINHVGACHPGGTKFDNGFACLICEIHYMNPFVLGKHMSKEHIPHELPYQCGSCPFRCSNHKQVIDHFYLRHDGGSSIQCPFCLKSTTVWTSGRNVAQNIHYFVQHLQKHQKKQFAKRCGKCNLWFVQKEILKEHQQKMHQSLRGKLGLIPYPSPRNGVMVPKSKMDKIPCDAEIINFSSLYYNVSGNSICKECNQAITSSKHFPSFDNCQNPNCQYSTCCAIAMMTHNAKCKGLNSVIPPESLPFEMFCVCGFKDTDGNSIAKHLAICEKKSAYPSEAEAKSATVMHSMLDILGLVRKPEESKTEKPSKLEKTEDSPKLSKKESDSNEINVLSDEEDTESTVKETPIEVDSENVESTEKENALEEDKNEDVIEIDEKSEDTENSIKENETIGDEKEIEELEKNSDVIELDDEDIVMTEILDKPTSDEPSVKEEKRIEESDKTTEIIPEEDDDCIMENTDKEKTTSDSDEAILIHEKEDQKIEDEEDRTDGKTNKTVEDHKELTQESMETDEIEEAAEKDPKEDETKTHQSDKIDAVEEETEVCEEAEEKVEADSAEEENKAETKKEVDANSAEEESKVIETEEEVEAELAEENKEVVSEKEDEVDSAKEDRAIDFEKEVEEERKITESEEDKAVEPEQEVEEKMDSDEVKEETDHNKDVETKLDNTEKEIEKEPTEKSILEENFYSKTEKDDIEEETEKTAIEDNSTSSAEKETENIEPENDLSLEESKVNDEDITEECPGTSENIESISETEDTIEDELKNLEDGTGIQKNVVEEKDGSNDVNNVEEKKESTSGVTELDENICEPMDCQEITNVDEEMLDGEKKIQSENVQEDTLTRDVVSAVGDVMPAEFGLTECPESMEVD